MGGKISDFPDLKKQTFALEIERMWGKDIIKEGARKIAYLRGGPRMEQGWQYIILPCLLSCVPANHLPTKPVVPLYRGNSLTASSSS